MSSVICILTDETPTFVVKIMWISMVTTVIFVSSVIGVANRTTYKKGCPQYQMIQEPVYKKINE
jgi:hypothetical protein